MARVSEMLDARHFPGPAGVHLYLARLREGGYTIFATDYHTGGWCSRAESFATRAAAEEAFANLCWPGTCRHPEHWEERARTPEGRRPLERTTVQ